MSDEKKDYEVGYGKPPKHTRFKKGQSGNSKGRPKGAKGLNASLKKEMESKVTVREGGREVTISKAEAAAKRVVQKALSGDMPALKMLAQLDAALQEQVEREAEQVAQAVVPDQTDEDVLRHFAETIQDSDFDPSGVIEPGFPEGEEDAE